jgi:hypothetical protein
MGAPLLSAIPFCHHLSIIETLASRFDREEGICMVIAGKSHLALAPINTSSLEPRK